MKLKKGDQRAKRRPTETSTCRAGRDSAKEKALGANDPQSKTEGEKEFKVCPRGSRGRGLSKQRKKGEIGIEDLGDHKNQKNLSPVRRKGVNKTQAKLQIQERREEKRFIP